MLNAWFLRPPVCSVIPRHHRLDPANQEIYRNFLEGIRSRLGEVRYEPDWSKRRSARFNLHGKSIGGGERASHHPLRGVTHRKPWRKVAG